jgi:hypothetical protein
MRHGDRVKHLGRPADQRKALIRALVTEVLRHGQIRTTKVRQRQQQQTRRRQRWRVAGAQPVVQANLASGSGLAQMGQQASVEQQQLTAGARHGTSLAVATPTAAAAVETAAQQQAALSACSCCR